MKVLLFVGLLAATALASHHSSDPSKDGEHFKGKEHDKKYDHEQFLGKDTAAEFDELTPEKSKEKLAYVLLKSHDLQINVYYFQQARSKDGC
ncbi:EF-hand domain-containing protein [Caenorhabditis elegans]|uniref:EF-hand domain-containing protein n=1 Tax=Caenorhabditis elegans TaxID=6239 RepID=H2L0I1_CAEEL|nr:EF-hand domain-containing protein [Caenorhabditis elegans]CCD83485.1 EF-hand domain-containing protein [Caenorhabditis elegans]|eukprot:NP_001024807.1 CALUmenin (calcium-binding protein) homolog [Caenorhabditis elegans]